LNLQMMKTCSLLEIRAIALLQWLGLPSFMSSCNDRKIFILLFGGSLFCFVFFKGGAGCCLNFYFLGVLGVVFFFGWFPLCVLDWFEIPLVLIVLAFKF
jgi:hypothetical protein